MLQRLGYPMGARRRTKMGLSPSSGAPRVRMEEHVFLARTGAPLTYDSIHKGGRSGLAAMWAARAMLSSLLREPHLDNTATLIDGWLPDGPITLD